MRVVFDYQIFYLQRYGGISRYFFELANELNLLDDCEPKIVAPFHANDYLKRNQNKSFISALDPVVYKMLYNRYFDRRVWTNEFIAKVLCKKKTAILHETYYTNRFPVQSKKVITIHDMIYELFNHGLQDEQKIMEDKKNAILEADAIIAVSESTRRDLLEFFPSVRDKTFVVHHGVSHVDHDKVKKYEHPKRYILYVGNRGWYKNFDMLLNVYAESVNIHKEFDLICFGGADPGEKEMSEIKKHQLENNVNFFTGNDSVLDSLYKSAAVLVYNSKYEGFGMPVLEAMQMGCPVICSNSSSLPEVSGDAALTVDPAEPSQLLKALENILFSTSVASGYRDQGLNRAKQFTWEKCAKETKKIYEKVLNG